MNIDDNTKDADKYRIEMADAVLVANHTFREENVWCELQLWGFSYRMSTGQSPDIKNGWAHCSNKHEVALMYVWTPIVHCWTKLHTMHSTAGSIMKSYEWW